MKVIGFNGWHMLPKLTYYRPVWICLSYSKYFFQLFGFLEDLSVDPKGNAKIRINNVVWNM